MGAYDPNHDGHHEINYIFVTLPNGLNNMLHQFIHLGMIS